MQREIYMSTAQQEISMEGEVSCERGDSGEFMFDNNHQPDVRSSFQNSLENRNSQNYSGKSSRKSCCCHRICREKRWTTPRKLRYLYLTLIILLLTSTYVGFMLFAYRMGGVIWGEKAWDRKLADGLSRLSEAKIAIQHIPHAFPNLYKKVSGWATKDIVRVPSMPPVDSGVPEFVFTVPVFKRPEDYLQQLVTTYIIGNRKHNWFTGYIPPLTFIVQDARKDLMKVPTLKHIPHEILKEDLKVRRKFDVNQQLEILKHSGSFSESNRKVFAPLVRMGYLQLTFGTDSMPENHPYQVQNNWYGFRRMVDNEILSWRECEFQFGSDADGVSLSADEDPSKRNKYCIMFEDDIEVTDLFVLKLLSLLNEKNLKEQQGIDVDQIHHFQTMSLTFWDIWPATNLTSGLFFFLTSFLTGLVVAGILFGVKFLQRYLYNRAEEKKAKLNQTQRRESLLENTEDMENADVENTDSNKTNEEARGISTLSIILISVYATLFAAGTMMIMNRREAGRVWYSGYDGSLIDGSYSQSLSGTQFLGSGESSNLVGSTGESSIDIPSGISPEDHVSTYIQGGKVRASIEERCSSWFGRKPACSVSSVGVIYPLRRMRYIREWIQIMNASEGRLLASDEAFSELYVMERSGKSIPEVMDYARRWQNASMREAIKLGQDPSFFKPRLTVKPGEESEDDTQKLQDSHWFEFGFQDSRKTRTSNDGTKTPIPYEIFPNLVQHYGAVSTYNTFLSEGQSLHALYNNLKQTNTFQGEVDLYQDL